MLDHARRLGAAENLRNVSYLRADAQAHRFTPGHFDSCISRFGTMFFTDPVASFSNIARALRPAARLVVLVWQSRERNEWSKEIGRAFAGTAASPGSAAGRTPFARRSGHHERLPGGSGLRGKQLHRAARACLLRHLPRHRLPQRAAVTGRTIVHNGI
ncbi:class I SAM-dependent methyltransferase [Saccharomonospora marina]|uniref:class I SAM-dependent methyltransferase n=1 Tax=Saccharomonospora marina TaxID=632569 RepID=UPI000319CB9F